jgi:hypothetical protein
MSFRQGLAVGCLGAALLYVAFILSLDPSHMTGDVYGYDPGTKALPLLAGLVMAGASLHLAVRERHAPALGWLEPRGLVLANLGLSVLFIVLFRHVGFIPMTGSLMFALLILNVRETGAAAAWGSVARWFALTMAELVLLFSMARGIVHLCYTAYHAAGWETLRDPFVQAAIETAVLVPVFVACGLLLRRRCGSSPFLTVSQTTVGTTIGIFLVFKEYFLVQLPKGLLFW